jgi:hypothetical protein
MLDGVDEIYRKPENAGLPIIAAIRIFTLKVKGSTPSEIENELAYYRKYIAQQPPPPPEK